VINLELQLEQILVDTLCLLCMEINHQKLMISTVNLFIFIGLAMVTATVMDLLAMFKDLVDFKDLC